MQQRLSIYNLSLEELEAWLAVKREARYRARQVFRWIYQRRVSRFQEMSDLSEGLRQTLNSEFCAEPLLCVRQTGSEDSTRKFLLSLPDRTFLESVLIPASPALYASPADRKTICVSTQGRCAFGCKFCASGLEGWTRNLEVGEIVQQILRVESLSGEKINNIVFMGMGEPLANYENLLKAIEIINAGWGVGIGARHITISTSGLVPRIRQLADQSLQIRLAISSYGATDEVRQKIMPINRRFNVASLVDACAYYRQRKRQRITFEYILIDQVNDHLDQAVELSRLANRLDAKVNLIPYNTVEGLNWRRPSDMRQQVFLRLLRRNGVDATIRREKGHDIDAACGQLRLQVIRDKSFAASGNLR